MVPDPVTFRVSDTSTLSLAVIEAIAEYEGTDPMSLDLTLHEHIDPEILDDLERAEMSNWSFSFVVGPYAIEVDHRHVITIDDRAANRGRDPDD